MTDHEFDGLWATLQPPAARRRRIDARVDEWLEAHDTTLAAEWFALFRVAPFSTAGLVAASVVSLATAPPIIWIARALM